MELKKVGCSPVKRAGISRIAPEADIRVQPEFGYLRNFERSGLKALSEPRHGGLKGEVEGGQHEQYQRHACDQSGDDGDGERLLHLRALAKPEGKRRQGQDGDGRRALAG